MSLDLQLDPSGLASTMLPGTRHLTSDLLLTPSTPQAQFFDRSTSLLMDRMHNTRTTPDPSPMVSTPTIVCTLVFLFFQNMLSSPLELRVGHASEEQLLASGNAVYLQSQLIIERQRRKITEMENQIRMLEMDVVIWKTRHTSMQ